ncbi:ECs_2282 family putative zinc-binding protein [Burkholderia vietnamiensis]|uniref:ECs_2282 family putative zinc-binding protein n=1 Tax=Burkholderia vietnamiensis TaxID=60552 RepID=UPI003F51141E
MSDGSISISFECKTCHTKLSWPDDIKDSDEVRCSGCGASAGSYAELKEAATNAAEEKLSEMIDDLFKRK